MFAVVSWQSAAADLLEIYRLAQANDPTFEVARRTLEATREKIPQTRANLLPSVNLTGNDNTNRAASTFSGTPTLDRNVHAWTWTMQLTQPLIRLQNVFAYTESLSLVDQAMAQFAQAEQDLILRVAQAYFEVLVAQESVSVAEAQLRAMNQQLDVARHGFEKGTVAITDVDEAKSRSDLARSQRVEALNDLDDKRSELEKLVGELPSAQTFAALKPAVVIPRPEPYDVQAWTGQSRENNPGVRAQMAALEAADSEVNRNRAEYAPTLDFTSSYGRNSSSGSLTTPLDFSTAQRIRQAGVQVTIPIFAGGGTNSRVGEAVANRYKTQAQLEAARRQAGSDARQAFSGIANGLAKVEALESAVESSLSAVKGNKAGYTIGLRINVDVLNAEQQYYTALRDLAKARYETLLQGLKLKAAAGALAEEDLVTINGLLAE